MQVALNIIIALICLSLVNATDTFAQEKLQKRNSLKPDKTETIKTALGVKSVLVSPDGSKVYSINLEGMSVYEFDRASRKILRKLAFIPHPGTGFDYTRKTSISSYQEKPVEGHFTHKGRYLWISLHNANGVVVWDLQSGDTWTKDKPFKEAWLYTVEPAGESCAKKKKVCLLWLKTGKTPKVITSSPDGRYLFVANWHSNTVSIIAIGSDNPAEWRKVKDLATGRVPRGMVVSNDSKFLYVAQMGGSGISVVDLATLKKVDEIKVGANPRHIVLGGQFLYVSLNAGSKIAKVDLATRKVVNVAKTGKYPRTIVLSADEKTLYVVCYKSDELEVFNANNLKLLGSWQSSLHPVGVDLFLNGKKREAWVGNYSSGTIKIFSFPVEKFVAVKEADHRLN